MGKLIIFGAGKLGGPVVDSLALRFPQHEYVLVSRSPAVASKRANLTRYIGAQWGLDLRVAPEAVNLLDTEATAALLVRHKPSVVFNATTPFPWWQIDKLPEKLALLANRAGPGVWAALDVLLPSALVRAREASGDSSIFVNGCYPDMTNAYLSGRVGAPMLGIGNLANLVPGLQLAFSNRDGVAATAIQIRLIAHHNVSLNAPSRGSSAGVPYILEVTNLASGATERFDEGTDYPFELLRERALRVRGLDGQGVTIASAATLLAAVLNQECVFHHSPGALGKPGGYPVRIDEDGTTALDLPNDVADQVAVTVNRRGQVADGIRDVRPGEVELSEEALAALSTITGVTVGTITPETEIDVANACIESLNTRYGMGLAL